MDAVVLAGGIPQPNEPLYSYSHGEAKALIDMAGKPMIQWVLDALGASKSIEHIVLIGLSDKAKLACKKPLTYLPNQGKLLENLKAGAAKVVELNPKAEYVLFVSSDIPSITPEMVEWLIATCKQTDDDLYYNVVRREDMERVFPGSRRTYTRLKDLAVCGGDMNMARASIVRPKLRVREQANRRSQESRRPGGLDRARYYLQILLWAAYCRRCHPACGR